MAIRDPIDLARTRSALVGTRFAQHLRHFAVAGSTNTLLLEAATAGAPEGTVYIADEQTTGRGRGRHAWHSAPGDGLYLSVLVRPALRLHDALLLSLATGLAVRDAVLETTALAKESFDLRWPNDLMLRDPAGETARKFGGILVETAVKPGPAPGHAPLLRHAVIGIGVNVHHAAFPPDLATQATSLHLARATATLARAAATLARAAATEIPQQAPSGDPPLARAPLLIAILRRLDLELLDLEQTATELPAPQGPLPEGSAQLAHARSHARLLARFTAASTWVRGRRVHVPEQDGYTGTTAGLDRRGFLLVDGDDGRRRTVLSGGVRDLADEAHVVRLSLQPSLPRNTT